MKKSAYWFIFAVVLVLINLSAIPLALFSLFDTQSGTSIFSIDYLIAFTILLIPNIVTISLFVSVRKGHVKSFFVGLVLAMIEVITMVSLFFNLDFLILGAIIMILCAIGGIILLVKPIKK